MSKLVVTCEKLALLPQYKEWGVQEVQFALKGYTFKGLSSFTIEEIEDAISIAKSLGLQTSILFDAILQEEEEREVKEVIERVFDLGIDYLVVSDFAIMQMAERMGRLNQIIYDPITLITNSMDAKTYEDLGLAYITISSCLTKEEIEEILTHIERSSLVVHGYLLMSVSKRKLLSSYFNYFQKNKMTDKYVLVEEKRDGKMIAIENERAMMIYSDFIQESFEEIKDFIAKGLKRLEIQTAFLEEEMIEDTIKLYRQLIEDKDCSKEIENYRKKYAAYPLEKGYYGEKTIK
ncbi:MAG: U32 family peptidase [Solobacterium sp.]|nr:U32 family peptidase [Solobacterium sp.]